jgi:multiple sugar transport system ATP-binding protein
VATVQARQVSKFFNDVLAVDGINLTAHEGEFLVLLGPSGCGKTTLMRMIAGLERPSAGDILIDDANVTEVPPRARNIAMVFQS